MCAELCLPRGNLCPHGRLRSARGGAHVDSIGRSLDSPGHDRGARRYEGRAGLDESGMRVIVDELQVFGGNVPLSRGHVPRLVGVSAPGHSRATGLWQNQGAGSTLTAGFGNEVTSLLEESNISQSSAQRVTFVTAW